MRELVVALDAALDVPGADALTLVALAQLGGADAVRIGPRDEAHGLRPVARRLELAMEPTPPNLKLALEVRPDRAVLRTPFDPVAVGPIVRSLREAGIGVVAGVAPELEAVKAAHAADLRAVELFTGHLAELPDAHRAPLLERLEDAARLAAKLQLQVSLGGGLDERSGAGIAARVPTAQRIAVGRAFVARALLVGAERAVRELRERLA